MNIMSYNFSQKTQRTLYQFLDYNYKLHINLELIWRRKRKLWENVFYAPVIPAGS